MIVATIVMLTATFLVFPWQVGVRFVVQFDKILGKLAVKWWFVRLFSIKIYIDGGKICYRGTVDGTVKAGGSSKVKLSGIELADLAVKLTCKPCCRGLWCLTVTNVVNCICMSQMRQDDFKLSVQTEFGDLSEVNIAAKCKFSLLSLLGV